MECSRRLFFKFYPSEPRKHKGTGEGHTLRRTIAVCLVFHMIFFLLSLAFIGFWPMLSDLLYSCLVYSIYLTLSKWAITFYEITLVGGIIYGILSLFPFTQTAQLLFYVLNLIFYGFALFFVWNANRLYRMSVKSLTKEALLTKKDKQAA